MDQTKGSSNAESAYNKILDDMESITYHYSSITIMIILVRSFGTDTSGKAKVVYEMVASWGIIKCPF